MVSKVNVAMMLPGAAGGFAALDQAYSCTAGNAMAHKDTITTAVDSFESVMGAQRAINRLRRR